LIFSPSDGRRRCFYYHAEGGGEIDAVIADTEADARAKMLIYLLEKGLLAGERLAAGR